MRKGKNIYYYPGRKRQKFVFKKEFCGKTISRTFSTLAKAEAFAEDFFSRIRRSGTDGLFFDAPAKKEYDEAKELCGGADLREAAKFWRVHYRAGAAVEVASAAAWSEFVFWLKESGRSPRHVSTIETTRRKFVADFGDLPVSKITSELLLKWATALPLAVRSRRNQIGNVINFLNWCKIAKSWVVEVPKIDDRLMPREVRSAVGIWTFEEAARAIRYIEQNERAYLPFYALRLFTGLRTAEAERFRWEWLDFKNHRITVPAEICKTRDAWVILPEFCPPTIWKWLEPWRGSKGAIAVPCGKARARISAACGWKPNVMRHTFATMHVALFHDEAKTILATRHTNIGTLRANYRGVNQTRADAEKFFALAPMPARSRER